MCAHVCRCWVHTCHSMHVGIRGQLSRVRSLIPHVGFQGLNSGGSGLPAGTFTFCMILLDLILSLRQGTLRPEMLAWKSVGSWGWPWMPYLPASASSVKLLPTVEIWKPGLWGQPGYKLINRLTNSHQNTIYPIKTVQCAVRDLQNRVLDCLSFRWFICQLIPSMI